MALSPQLLCQLQDHFEDVAIANEGEEQIGLVARDAYTGGLRRHLAQSGEYYRVNCPFCTDTRKRLWINHRWGQRDPDTGSLNLHLAICYNAGCLGVPGRVQELYRLVSSPFAHERYATAVKQAHQPTPLVAVRWPGYCTPVHQMPPDYPAPSYLRERGFDVHALGDKLGVHYCYSASAEYGLAQSRLIVPVYLHGALRGWQARCVGESPPQLTPKYFTMPRMKKSALLYNYDSARRYPYVLICEGVTDVWRAGPASVALFGKSMSALQKALIAAAWSQGTAVVLLDGDAAGEAQQIYDALAGVVRRRVLVKLPDGTDPADLSVADLQARVQEAAARQGVSLVRAAG
ncbi:MAG: hypothetical protein JNM56_12980 [Planctomycetia bacterium]|nr:hypothetical protein [Planctomycetia bacterium]